MFSCLGSVTCVRILGLNIYLPNDCVDCAGAVRSCCSYCPSMSLVPYGRSFRPPWRSVSLELLILHPPRLFFAFIGNGKSLKNRWQHWCCRFPLAEILAAKLFSPFLSAFPVGTRPLARKREHTASPSLIFGTAGWRLVKRHTERHLIQSNPSRWTRLAFPSHYRCND